MKKYIVLLSVSFHVLATQSNLPTRETVHKQEKEEGHVQVHTAILSSDFLDIIKEQAEKKWSRFFMPLSSDFMMSLGIKKETIELMKKKQVFVPHNKKVGVAIFDNGVNAKHEFVKENIHFIRNFSAMNLQKKTSINDPELASRGKNYFHALGIASAAKQIYPQVPIFSMSKDKKPDLLLSNVRNFIELQTQKRKNILPHIKNPLSMDQAKIINFSFSIGGDERNQKLKEEEKTIFLELVRKGNIIVLSGGNKASDLCSTACASYIDSWKDFFENGITDSNRNTVKLTDEEKNRFVFVGGTQIQGGKIERWKSGDPSRGSSYFSKEPDDAENNPVYQRYIFAPAHRLFVSYVKNTYNYQNGTSYAAPIVCGVLAYLVNEFGLTPDGAVEHLLNSNKIKKDQFNEDTKVIPGRILDFHKTIETLKDPQPNDHKEIEKMQSYFEKVKYRDPYSSHTIINNANQNNINQELLFNEIEKRALFAPDFKDDITYTKETLEKMAYDLLFMQASDLSKILEQDKDPEINFDDFYFFEQIKEFSFNINNIKGINESCGDNFVLDDVNVKKHIPNILTKFFEKLKNLKTLTIDEPNNPKWTFDLTINPIPSLSTLNIKAQTKDFIEKVIKTFYDPNVKNIENIIISYNGKEDIKDLLKNIHEKNGSLIKVEWVNEKNEPLYLYAKYVNDYEKDLPYLKTLVTPNTLNVGELIKNRAYYPVLEEVYSNGKKVDIEDYLKFVGGEMIINDLKKRPVLKKEEKEILEKIKEEFTKLKKKYGF